MQRFILALLVVLVQNTHAKSIKDYNPYNYEVYFTNPVCKEYKYAEPVYAIDGTYLSAKPKNVYCKRSDFALNENREDTPHFQLLKLINNKNVNEIFLAFLSFSNSDVADALCSAIENRNLKVTFIIDSKNKERPSGRRLLDKISQCRPKNLTDDQVANIPQTMFRGNIGGLGYAHNKIILAQYKNDPEKVKLVYGSGNMSSGTILHHENWHFVTTNIKTHLVQSHFCVKEGMIKVTDSRSGYKRFIKKCRKDINIEAEDDISFYVVPAEGKKAMQRITDAIEQSVAIDGAAHRLSHPEVYNGLINASQKDIPVRFIVDDDIYWTGRRNIMTGFNTFLEFANIMKMVRGDVNIRYMQTNQNHRLLHHNKFLIFKFEDGSGAVHTGAGNFTKSAFYKNFENYYFIQIPEVVEAFKKQYDYMFNELATDYYKMPKTYVNP